MDKKKLTKKAQEIIKLARTEANSYGDTAIRPEHIFSAVLVDSENECLLVFDYMGLDTEVLYNLLSKHIRDSDLRPRVNNHLKDVRLTMSNETATLYKKLPNECDNLGDKVINELHLILAVLSDTKNPVVNFLTSLKVTYNRFKNSLLAIREEEINSHFDEDDEDFHDDRFSKRSSSGVGKPKGNSKTPVLDNFSRNVTKAVEMGLVDPVIGRDVEIKRIATILSRRTKNNPVIIGEPGVGKSAIVEGLTQRIHSGNAPRPLLNKEIRALDLSAMVAGTKYRGMFEERMKALINEVKSNKNIVLFIDELHTIMGAGNASGSLDASNMLKPALARGEVQIIGATTLNEYRENIESDGAMTRRFQSIILSEPTVEETINILNNIKIKYEDHHHCSYSNEAIVECVNLADRYITDRAMPDKAIDIMDEAGAATNMSLEKPESIKKLEQEKAELSIRKKESIQKQEFEESAVIRDAEQRIKTTVDKAMSDWRARVDAEITPVGPDQMAEVVSTMTGIPVTKISVEETKRILNMESNLNKKLVGQSEAVNKIVKAIKRNSVGIRNKTKPIASFIFLGPTGVGKTELAKQITHELFNDQEAMIRIDMTEYMEKFAVSKLIGAPPGYVGYEQGGQLTEKVRRKPYSLVLLDEIEKAHPDIFNILLQVLDDGHLSDGLGRKINFKNTVIIMTSNVGASEASAFGTPAGFNVSTQSEDRKREIMEKALKRAFKPEFLNRVDDIVYFNKLNDNEMGEIVKLGIDKLVKTMKENEYNLQYNEDVVNFITAKSKSEEYGARPVARNIQKYIEDTISDEILNNKINTGDTIKLSVKDDLIVCKASKGKKSLTK